MLSIYLIIKIEKKITTCINVVILKLIMEKYKSPSHVLISDTSVCLEWFNYLILGILNCTAIRHKIKYHPGARIQIQKFVFFFNAYRKLLSTATDEKEFFHELPIK